MYLLGAFAKLLETNTG